MGTTAVPRRTVLVSTAAAINNVRVSGAGVPCVIHTCRTPAPSAARIFATAPAASRPVISNPTLSRIDCCSDACLLPTFVSLSSMCHFLPCKLYLPGLPAHHTTRCCASVLLIFHHSRPVDPYIADACRELVRVLEGGPVGDGSRVEDDDVGVVAGAQQAAILQSEAGSDGPAHLANRVFQCEQFLFAHVLCQHSRIGAVGTRMRGAFLLRPGRV